MRVRKILGIVVTVIIVKLGVWACVEVNSAVLDGVVRRCEEANETQNAINACVKWTLKFEG